MKDKRNNENVKETRVETPDEKMQELDEDDLDKIAGGVGNPFGDRPRMGYQPIDDDLRNNG